MPSTAHAAGSRDMRSNLHALVCFVTTDYAAAISRNPDANVLQVVLLCRFKVLVRRCSCFGWSAVRLLRSSCCEYQRMWPGKRLGWAVCALVG
jgi:hypothetical protein